MGNPFHRLSMCRTATDPETLEAWLIGDADSASRLSEDQRANLDEIDRLATALPWRARGDLRPRVDDKAGYLLALDEPSPRRRLRTIVVRAYWRTALFADLYADHLDNLDHILQARDRIERALEVLGVHEWEGMGSAVDFLRMYRHMPEAEMENILKGVQIGAVTLERIADYLGRIHAYRKNLAGAQEQWYTKSRDEGTELFLTADPDPSKVPSQTKTRDEVRPYFAICLAEAFSLATGTEIKYSLPTASPLSPWQELIVATFNLTRLGVQGLDDMLRGLNSRATVGMRDAESAARVGHKSRRVANPLLRDRLERLAHFLDDVAPGDPLFGERLDFCNDFPSVWVEECYAPIGHVADPRPPAPASGDGGEDHHGSG